MVPKLVLCLVMFLVATSRKPGSAASCPADSTWNGDRCACDVNKINVNGKCVCDYGYWLNGKNCVKCDSNNNWNGSPCAGTQSSCPAGSKWSGSCCQFDWSTNNCGDGRYYNGKFCADNVYPVFCKAGYVWNQAACVPKLRNLKKCPDGNYWDGKQCTKFINPPVCGAGVWDSYTGDCVVQSPSVPDCGTGKFWNGDICSNLNYYPVCPRGSYWNSKQCVAIRNSGDISCLSGCYWNGEACIAQSNSVTCGPGANWDNEDKNCVRWGCNANMVFNPLTQICTDVSTLQGLNQLFQAPIIGNSNGNIIGSNGGMNLLHGVLTSIGSQIPLDDPQPFVASTPSSASSIIVVAPGTVSTSGGN